MKHIQKRVKNIKGIVGVLVFSGLLISATGCRPNGESSNTESSSAESLSAENPRTENTENTENTKATKNQPSQQAQAEERGCDHGEHHHAKAPSEAQTATLPGETAVGEPVTEAVELVNAADIIANPDQFEGRTVRLKGTVKGYCHHARAWFALDVPGATPPYIRVVTAPSFYVPHGVINNEATTVGTIELRTIPGSRAHHYESEHALGSGNEDGGPVKRAILRASGAFFEPAS